MLIGVSTGIVDRIFGGSSPKTIASASLQSMRAENRLTVFAARYVSVVTSSEQKLGGLVSSERTLILPGDVRYELDLSKLQPKSVTWDNSSGPDSPVCRRSTLPARTSISTRSRNMAGAGSSPLSPTPTSSSTRPIAIAPSPTFASRQPRQSRCGSLASPRARRWDGALRCRCSLPASRT